jgi:hypothetical protein
MTFCSDDHDEVVFQGSYSSGCPACRVKKDLEDEISEKEEEIVDLKEELLNLKNIN